MDKYQFFCVALAVLCAGYAVYSVAQANKDKSDPMYGQCIAAAIWEGVFAAFCLMIAFTRQ